MKALSLKQPWAYAILRLGKNVENRTWRTNYRGRVVIHASKTFDREGRDWLMRNGYKQLSAEAFITGGYVGEMTITDCVHVSELENSNYWAFGPWCWLVEDVVAYDQIIPAKGHLGIYNIKEGWPSPVRL